MGRPSIRSLADLATPSQRSWIPVLGREKGRIFSHARPGASLELVSTLDFSDVDDRASDAPGRVHERHGQARHAMEPPDLDEAARTRMARAVAGILAKGLEDREYDRLLVVAGPDILGALRHELAPRVAERVVGELDKNLGGADERGIAQQVDDIGTLGPVRVR